MCVSCMCEGCELVVSVRGVSQWYVHKVYGCLVANDSVCTCGSGIKCLVC